MTKQDGQLTLTVGIPTCYGGKSLVDTVKSLRASRGVPSFRLIVVADRTPIPGDIRQKLAELGVELYWNDVEGSQMKKVNQIIEKLDSDIFVNTQDDIIFHPDALREILLTFAENAQVTMVGSRVLPLPAENFFENGVAGMVRLVDRIGRKWNGGDNRLMASGRCLSYRVGHLKKITIPERIINADFFMYLVNKQFGGKFTTAQKSFVYIRCPQTLKDQLGPSSRFQFQKKEVSEYLGPDILYNYAVPKPVIIEGVIKEAFRHPIDMLIYSGIFVLTRIKRQPKQIVRDPMWNVDHSTKQGK